VKRKIDFEEVNGEDTSEECEEQDSSLSEQLSSFPDLTPAILSMSINDFLNGICAENGVEVVKEMASVIKGKHWSYLSKRFFQENDILELYNIIHEVTQEYQIVLEGNAEVFMKGFAQTIKSLKGITSLRKLINSEPAVDFEKIKFAVSSLLEIRIKLEKIISETELEKKKNKKNTNIEELSLIVRSVNAIKELVIDAKLEVQKELSSKKDEEQPTTTKKQKRKQKKQKLKNQEDSLSTDATALTKLDNCASALVDLQFVLNNIIKDTNAKEKDTNLKVEQIKQISKVLKSTSELLDSNNSDIYTEDSQDYRKLDRTLSGLSKRVSKLFEHIAQSYVKIIDNKSRLERIHAFKKDIISEVSQKGGNMMLSGQVKDIPDYQSQLDREENNLIAFVQNPDFQPKNNPFYRNNIKKEEEETKKEEDVF